MDHLEGHRVAVSATHPSPRNAAWVRPYDFMCFKQQYLLLILLGLNPNERSENIRRVLSIWPLDRPVQRTS